MNFCDVGVVSKTLMLFALYIGFANGDTLTPEEIDAYYAKIAAWEGVSTEEMEAINNSKVAITVSKRTPLYEKPSKSSRVVDYVGEGTNYTWRCFPAQQGVKWVRCASDEYMFIE